MGSIRILSRILRIRVRLHYTWFFVIVVMAAAVVTQFSMIYPLWQRIILGVVASFLFLLTVSIREFVLSYIATRKGIRVESITLFAFGGLFQVDRDTTTPALELLLAALGLLFDLTMAGVLAVVYFVLVQTGNIMVDVLVQWLAFIWFMLALFHFVPGYPLDGGRALRALFWRLTDSYEKATRLAGWTGWGIGLVITIGGILLLAITREWFAGAFLVAVGLILQNAATRGRHQVRENSVSNVKEQNG